MTTTAGRAPRVSYYHDETIAIHASVEGSLLKPHILKLTHELIKAYGLPQHMRVCLSPAQWQPASASDISRFHTDAYLTFLQQLECNAIEVRDEAGNFVLNPSVVFTETAWLYAQSYTGGSLAAAQSVRSGESDIGICWMGGQTHARRDCASGFSFVNDVVLAVLALLTPLPDEPPQDERRVLVVNLDAWHCSGVEEAFYTTDRVLCLSLHHYADGMYPGSGGSADSGEEKGKHHTINLPVTDGLTDAELIELLPPVLAAAAERFCPHAIVCCAGAGIIAGDRLGCLNVSLSGHEACLKALMALEVPLLVLGGAGFTQLNTAKAWCSATATLCGVDLPDQLPEHEYLDYYAPQPTLAVPLTTQLNHNDAAALAKLKEQALHSVSEISQRSKPVLKPKRPPPDAPSGAAGEADASTGDVLPVGAPPQPPSDADAEMRPAEGTGAGNGNGDANDENAAAMAAGAAGAASENEPAAASEGAAGEDGVADAAMEVDEGGSGLEPPADARQADARIEGGMVANEPSISAQDD